jgi:hypothetical protein
MTTKRPFSVTYTDFEDYEFHMTVLALDMDDACMQVLGQANAKRIHACVELLPNGQPSRTDRPFFEEKVIDGILMRRNSEQSSFHAYTKAELTERLLRAENYNNRIKQFADDYVDTLDDMIVKLKDVTDECD